MTMEFKAFEVKADEKEAGVVFGYAAFFGNVDRGHDILVKGSFKKQNVKVPLLLNHDQDKVVGHAWVSEDEKGLFYKGILAINSESEGLRKRAQEAYALVKEGHVATNSMGYRALKTSFDRKTINGQQLTVRKIEQLDLAEVSIVTVPMNPQAQILSVKKYQEEMSETPEASPLDRLAFSFESFIYRKLTGGR
jgi:uncharacterized protein